MLILGLLLRLHSLEEKQKVSKGSPSYGVSKGQAAYAVRLRGTLTDTNAGREKQSFFFSFLFTVFFRLLFPKYLQGYFNYSYICFRVLRCYLPISYLSAQELQLPMNILNPSIMFDRRCHGISSGREMPYQETFTPAVSRKCSAEGLSRSSPQGNGCLAHRAARGATAMEQLYGNRRAAPAAVRPQFAHIGKQSLRECLSRVCDFG